MKAEEQASSSQDAITRSNLRRAAKSTYSYDEVKNWKEVDFSESSRSSLKMSTLGNSILF